MDSIAQQIHTLKSKDKRLQGFELELGQWTSLQGPGSGVLDAWAALRAEASSMKAWPLITGKADASNQLFPEQRADLTAIETCFAQARALDLSSWIQEQWEGIDPADFEADAEDFEAEFGGIAAKIQPNHSPSIARDVLSQEPYEQAQILLVPVGKSWEIPAHLGIGGWNACPETAVHLRLLENWYLKYEADLLGFSGDVMELKVGKPVTDMQEALKLARVQYAFCPDLIEQGLMSLDNLAKSLIDSSIWYFWWD